MVSLLVTDGVPIAMEYQAGHRAFVDPAATAAALEVIGKRGEFVITTAAGRTGRDRPKLWFSCDGARTLR